MLRPSSRSSATEARPRTSKNTFARQAGSLSTRKCSSADAGGNATPQSSAAALKSPRFDATASVRSDVNVVAARRVRRLLGRVVCSAVAVAASTRRRLVIIVVGCSVRPEGFESLKTGEPLRQAASSSPAKSTRWRVHQTSVWTVQAKMRWFPSALQDASTVFFGFGTGAPHGGHSCSTCLFDSLQKHNGPPECADSRAQRNHGPEQQRLQIPKIRGLLRPRHAATPQ